MKRPCRDTLDTEAREARAQLARRLIGERDREDLRRLERARGEWSRVGGEVRELQRMVNEIRTVQDRASGGIPMLDILAALHEAVPKNVKLIEFNLEGERQISLRGVSPTLADAVQLVNILETSPLFEAVELKSSNVVRASGRDSVEFHILGKASS